MLAVNALPTFVGEAVYSRGWLLAVLNLFDVSAIVWLAIGAGLALLWQADDHHVPRRADWTVAGAAAIAALVPLPPLSGAVLSFVGLWGWMNSPARSPGRRAAAIFLSLSTFLFWGRVFLALGAGPLLAADAQFVSLISGLPANGNELQFADGTHFVVAPGCSSLHGISLALILWVTAVAWFDFRLTARLRWTLAAAIVASVLVNGARLAVIAWYPRDFDFWHEGNGAAAFGWIALVAVTAVVYRGLAGAQRAL